MVPDRIMGEVSEQRWTCIAASTFDDDGNEVPAPDEVGSVIVERYVYFAYRAEAEAWLVEQEEAGFVRRGDPCPAATFTAPPTRRATAGPRQPRRGIRIG